MWLNYIIIFVLSAANAAFFTYLVKLQAFRARELFYVINRIDRCLNMKPPVTDITEIFRWRDRLISINNTTPRSLAKVQREYASQRKHIHDRLGNPTTD